MAGLVGDVGPHEWKRESQRKQSESRRPLQGVFRSRGNASLECSTDLLMPASESTGAMNRLSEYPVGDSELWNLP